MEIIDKTVEWFKHKVPEGWAHSAESAQYRSTVGLNTYNYDVKIQRISSSKEEPPCALRLSRPSQPKFSLVLSPEAAFDLADRLIKGADDISEG